MSIGFKKDDYFADFVWNFTHAVTRSSDKNTKTDETLLIQYALKDMAAEQRIVFANFLTTLLSKEQDKQIIQQWDSTGTNLNISEKGVRKLLEETIKYIESIK
jgi:hypothetical protein